jgi:hypothetical protein
MEIESFKWDDVMNMPIENGTLLQKLGEKVAETYSPKFNGVEYNVDYSIKPSGIYVSIKERK